MLGIIKGLEILLWFLGISKKRKEIEILIKIVGTLIYIIWIDYADIRF